MKDGDQPGQIRTSKLKMFLACACSSTVGILLVALYFGIWFVESPALNWILGTVGALAVGQWLWRKLFRRKPSSTPPA